MRTTFRLAACVAALAFLVNLPARAQSEASAAVSLLPVASVVGTASVAGTAAGALSVAPLVASGTAAVLTVVAVDASARSTVYVLERASDGARFSVNVARGAVAGVSLATGASVTASVIGSGLLLSAAGEAIAFIPNALGQALLHNERLTR